MDGEAEQGHPAEEEERGDGPTEVPCGCVHMHTDIHVHSD